MAREKTEVGYIHAGAMRKDGIRPDSLDSNGTVVPGAIKYAPGVSPVSQNNDSNEPVVGFLYSISRQGIGEYWPLHIGRNIIGRSSDCDIRLCERTVSDHHAALNIKQMKTTNKILASIKDEGSKNGIFVNDEELTYDAHPCKNHDIITIGLHYKLLLILIDTEEFGLTISEDFMEETSTQDPTPRFDQNYDSQKTNSNLYERQYHASNNLETIPGTGDFPKPGKTELM